MRAHIKYLSYVLRHKWFVFQEGRKLGVPLWQLIAHDWHKFLPCEWFPYVDWFYGGPFPSRHELPSEWRERAKTKESAQEAFDRAWLHHIHMGRHHPQHWILRQDDGEVKCLQMPWNYRLEMLADWSGAGRAQGKVNDTVEWYLENGHRYPMHPETRALVEAHLGVADNQTGK